jgi:hypothetical protein
MFLLQYQSIAHYLISDVSNSKWETAHQPQSSHHALIISFPSIPFTVCVFGSGPSCLITAFGVKIWAECLSISAVVRVVLKHDLQSSSPSTAICTIYFVSSFSMAKEQLTAEIHVRVLVWSRYRISMSIAVAVSFYGLRHRYRCIWRVYSWDVMVVVCSNRWMRSLPDLRVV